MAALDLYNGLLGCAARSVNEIHKAVYTFVCAFASILARVRFQQGHGPELELVTILFRQRASAPNIHRFTDDIVVVAWNYVES